MAETNYARRTSPPDTAFVASTLVSALPTSAAASNLMVLDTNECNQIDVILKITRVAMTLLVITPLKSYDKTTWYRVGSSSIAAGVDTLTPYSISRVTSGGSENISFSMPCAWPYTAFFFTPTAASTDTIEIASVKSVV